MARTSYPLRCVGCRLHPAECICDVVRQEAAALIGRVRTRVVVVIHSKEMSRSTNTGFLAERLLPGCEIRVRGAKDRDVDLGDLARPGSRAVALFPHPEARILTAEAWAGEGDAGGGRPQEPQEPHEPLVLVVPDGSWGQAGRMVRRDTVLARLPRVTLAPGRPAGYRLRKSLRRDGLCTLEAIGRALSVLEGPVNGVAVRHSLERVLDAQVRGTLRMRGRADRIV